MADLLVEIRCEEVPARKVREAAAALRDGLAGTLERAGLLEPGAAAGQPILGTPRRLAAFLPGVEEGQRDSEERVWGPPVAAAFDGAGNPTKAGEGFARKSGVPLDSLQRGEKVPGKPPYLYCDRAVKGRSAAEIVAEALPAVASSLPFRRTMRWPQSPVPFVRPIRGLVVLLGSEVVPVELAGVESGRTTRGHAFLSPGPLEIPAADLLGYVEALRDARVVVDWEERHGTVESLVMETRRILEAHTGETQSTLEQLEQRQVDQALCEEVADLVEWPSALTGEFGAEYASLPVPVLVTSMAHHLRFFPVFGTDGRPLNRFVSIMDRLPESADLVRPGNERVLRARLYDANFFHANDRKRPLEGFRSALDDIDFHRGLGTLLDKSERVRKGVAALAGPAGLTAEETEAADRAALLLKCDLLTEVVREFTELQGIVGAHYALGDGEVRDVALALQSQYLPAGVALWNVARRSAVAALVGAAERADSLAAYFSIGEEPTGSADPFGLRRAALALLDILRQREDWSVSLEDVLAPAADAWGLDGEVRARLVSFVWTRAEQAARADGYTDFVDCVGALTGRPYPEYRRRLEALQDLAGFGWWRDLVALVERTGNMAEEAEGPPTVDLPAEAQALADALASERPILEAIPVPLAFAERYLSGFGSPVNAMFEEVLVDDPEHPERRAAIRGLLHEIYSLFAHRIGDLRRLGSGAKPPRT
jgi:glycyl-tRNA synthetase beta chain